jgi:hypothetical protein
MAALNELLRDGPAREAQGPALETAAIPFQAANVGVA